MNHLFRFCTRITLACVTLVFAQISCTVLAAEETNETNATSAKTESVKIPEALGAAGFSKFASLIEAAGLSDTFNGEGPFTCFAPTDEAMDKMPEPQKKDFAKNPKSEDSLAWIKYHFVAGMALKKDDLMKIPGANGFAGRYLRVWVSKGKITLNRVCEFTKFDIVASNGVIHGVSRVLNADDEVKVFQKPADSKEGKHR